MFRAPLTGVVACVLHLRRLRLERHKATGSCERANKCTSVMKSFIINLVDKVR